MAFLLKAMEMNPQYMSSRLCLFFYSRKCNSSFTKCSLYVQQVRGCVDLRHLVLLKNGVAGVGGSHHLGLNALSKTFLNYTLDKDWRIRASDWEAESLTRRQVSGIVVFVFYMIKDNMQIFERISTLSFGASSFWVFFLLEPWEKC